MKLIMHGLKLNTSHHVTSSTRTQYILIFQKSLENIMQISYKLISGLWKIWIIQKRTIHLNILPWLMTILIFIILPLWKYSHFLPNTLEVSGPPPKAKYILSFVNKVQKDQDLYYAPINNLTSCLIEKIRRKLPYISSLFDAKYLISM